MADENREGIPAIHRAEDFKDWNAMRKQTERALRYWAGIDWDLPTAVICEITGKRANVVSKARRKYAPETIGTINKKAIIAAEKWASVDWRKRTCDIARETGEYFATVVRARQRYAP